MQPSNLKKRRSKTKVSEKDLLKCSNYAVTTQEQDSDGDIETKIFKGDIIPTATGGAQIVFNDVETLTQKSPEKSPKSRPMTRRSSKRSLEEQQQLASVGSRVAAFEKRQKRFR
jgi:kinesin family protein 23